MAASLHYNSDKRFLTIIVSGSLSFEEFDGIGQTIMASTEYPADVNTLWDLRQADFSGINSQTLRQYLFHREKYSYRGNTKIAFVTADDVSFGLMRMYEMLSVDLPQQIMVFKNYQEAEDWLVET